MSFVISRSDFYHHRSNAGLIHPRTISGSRPFWRHPFVAKPEKINEELFTFSKRMETTTFDVRYPIGRVELPQSPLSASERTRLIRRMADFPAQLNATVATVGEEKMEQAYRPGGWTGRQVVHHLADVHLNFYLRFHLALTVEHPTVPGIDQNAWAQLPDVAATPISVSLALLDSLHTRWAILMQHLTEAQWQRGFHHPVYQKDFTLEQALVQADWHGRHHEGHLKSLIGA